MTAATKQAPANAADRLKAREYQKFLAALDQYNVAQENSKEADHQKDLARGQVITYIQDIGEDYLVAGDFRVSYVAGRLPEKLDGNLLYAELLEIMTADEADKIIQRCTTGGGLKSPSLRVIRKGGEE